MTRWRYYFTSAATGLLLMAVCLPVKAAEGIREEQLKVLAERLRQDAEQWITDELKTERLRETARQFKAVTYDVESLVALKRHLKAAKNTPQDLYVVNRLISPLLLAETGVIQEVLVDVKQMYRRLGNYKTPSTLPIKELSDKKKQERFEADKLLAKQNREVRSLNRTVFQLMLMAGVTREDMALIKELTTEERKGSWAYVDIVEIVQSRARSLTLERAEMFYEAFVALGGQLRDKKAMYRCLFEMVVALGKKPVIEEKSDAPGVRLLKAANLLAPVAKKPAVVVPGEKVPGKGKVPRKRWRRR